MKNILILGVSGMLGSTLYKYLSMNESYKVYGTVRSSSNLNFFSQKLQKNIFNEIDVLKEADLLNIFKLMRPDVVINCIGVVKQDKACANPLKVLPINSIFPHQLDLVCQISNARLIHFSTDCVFSGKTGMYLETDFADAEDLYGRSKYLGEVTSRGAVTLRTSIIGHELSGNKSLVNWFLSQSKFIYGYKKAIFSGVSTFELSRIIDSYILPNESLSGVYHVSAKPITKYDLLKLIAEIYGHNIEIRPNNSLIIDRSLDSSLFRSKAGYHPPSWSDMVANMNFFSNL
jgi:dTDP-4-dehydrorhamnose reductase